MASSSRPAPPLQPRGSPPPPSPPIHDAMLALSLALPSPQPVAWASPSSSSSPSPRPRKKRRLALRADGTPFPRARPSPTTGDAPPSPCTLCGKQFSSYKALHGHMRCHPDRPWRGMTAPQQFIGHGFAAPERDAGDGLLVMARLAADQFAVREPEAAANGLDLLLDAANRVDMMEDGASASSPAAHKCVCACGNQWQPQYGGETAPPEEATATEPVVVACMNDELQLKLSL